MKPLGPPLRGSAGAVGVAWVKPLGPPLRGSLGLLPTLPWAHWGQAAHSVFQPLAVGSSDMDGANFDEVLVWVPVFPQAVPSRLEHQALVGVPPHMVSIPNDHKAFLSLGVGCPLPALALQAVKEPLGQYDHTVACS